MRFKREFFRNYLNEAPVPLALERALECEILSQQPFERPILDIGCGEGMFAHVLFDEPVDVGIDPQAGELERAREYGAYLELIQCGGSSIPKRDGEFKTIFSNSVLEHIADIEPVLKEARRLLAPSGRFYVTVPTHLFERHSLGYQFLSGLGLESLAAAFGAFFNRFWRHYHFFTPEGWTELFGRAGFEVVASRQYCPKDIGLFNDAMAFPALGSFVVKKLLNRWFLFPAFRRLVTAPVLERCFRGLVRIDPKEDRGGIVFFALRRTGLP